MLTKQELEMLQSFLERQDLKGKQWIEDFIWRNTVQTKFSVGETVKFDAKGQYHFGVSPRNWTGKITKIRYFARWNNNERAIQYEIEYQYQVNGTSNVLVGKTYQLETDVHQTLQSSKLINIIQKKNEHQEYLTL